MSAFDSMMFTLMMSQGTAAGQGAVAAQLGGGDATDGTAGATGQAGASGFSQLSTDLQSLMGTLSGYGTSSSSAGASTTGTDTGATLASEVQSVLSDLGALALNAGGAPSAAAGSVASSDTAWPSGFPPPPEWLNGATSGASSAMVQGGRVDAGQSGTVDIGQGGSFVIGQIISGEMAPFMFGFDATAGASDATSASGAVSSDPTGSVASSHSLSANFWPGSVDWQAIVAGSDAGSSQGTTFSVNRQLALAVSAYTSGAAYGEGQNSATSVALTA